jgi:hypothetical protein
VGAPTVDGAPLVRQLGELLGEPLAAGERVVVWNHEAARGAPKRRRAVVSLAWPEAKDVVDRVCRRFDGHGRFLDLQRRVLALSDVGVPVLSTIAPGHHVGWVRVLQPASELERDPQLCTVTGHGPEPILLALGGLRVPIVFRDIQRGRQFWRAVEAATQAHPPSWDVYAAEHHGPPRSWLATWFSGTDITTGTLLEHELGRACADGWRATA